MSNGYSVILSTTRKSNKQRHDGEQYEERPRIRMPNPISTTPRKEQRITEREYLPSQTALEQPQQKEKLLYAF